MAIPFSYNKSFAVLSLVALLLFVLAASTFADDLTGTSTITGGSLAFGATEAPSLSVTLDGTNKTPTDTFPINLNDARGSGEGWSLQITATTFESAEGKTLSNSAASITGVAVACDVAPCTAPTNSTSYAVAIPANTTAPTAVKFFTAAADTGMGDFTLTPTIQVAVPANSYAGEYESTITITNATGP